MKFLYPGYLLFILLLIPMALYLKKRKKLSFAFPSIFFVNKKSLKGLANLSTYFYLSSLLFFIIALARPQKGFKIKEILNKGINIAIVIDASGSMLAEDFKPNNRLYVAKKVAVDFINKRKGDRFALVMFAGSSISLTPLTSNSEILDSLIERTTSDKLPDGTAIGMGLASAINRLKNIKSHNKVIILLTDGVNNTGAIDPLAAAEIAKTFGIKIYTIGVGSYGPVPYPFKDDNGNIHYSMVTIDLDEQTLRKIAEITNGQYYKASDSKTLKKIYKEIDKLEPSTYKVKTYTLYTELYRTFLIIGTLFFLMAILADFLFLRRYP